MRQKIERGGGEGGSSETEKENISFVERGQGGTRKRFHVVQYTPAFRDTVQQHFEKKKSKM